MNNKFKTFFLVISFLLISGCRSEVFNDQPINESKEVIGNVTIEGYTELEEGIYINDSIEKLTSILPPSYDMAEINSEMIAGNIAQHYALPYSLEEIEVDNHTQTQIIYGQNIGKGRLTVNSDSSIYMDLNFGNGSGLASILSGVKFKETNENLKFRTKNEIEEESAVLLEAFTGFNEFKFITYSITEEDLSQIITEQQKIAEELGKPLPPVDESELYYVHAIPLINKHEILAFEILGREEDWTLFNPGAEIKLIFTENGLQNLYINPLYIPGESISGSAVEPEYDHNSIVEMAVNRFKERLDKEPVLIDAVDFVYLTYVPDQSKREKIYKPFWRMIIKSEEGAILHKLYFDPLTGSEYL